MLATILVTAGLVGLDQLLKWLVVRFVAPVDAIAVIPGVVELRYLENTGAAFSLFDGRQGVLISVTSIALTVLVMLLIFRRPKDKLEYLSFVMILSGGIGNLVDRVMNGYVVDYINPLFVRFAVFNFADCLVCIGFALLVVAVFRAEGRNKKAALEAAQEKPDAATVSKAGKQADDGSANRTEQPDERCD